LDLLAKHEALSALELCRNLELADATTLKPWIERLVEIGIVRSSGRTKGTMYHVAPDLIKRLDFKTTTTLKDIEEYRLKELVISDIRKYRKAGISEIHDRIGQDIPWRRLQMVRRFINRKCLKIVFHVNRILFKECMRS